MLKKLLALFVAAMMVFSIIPVSSFAEKAVAPPAASEKAPTAEPIPTPPAVAEEEPAFEALEAIPITANQSETQINIDSLMPLSEVKLCDKPAPEKWATAEGWDFESNPAAAGWVFYDYDQDSYNWEWSNDTYGGQPIASGGERAIKSSSYIHSEH